MVILSAGRCLCFPQSVLRTMELALRVPRRCWKTHFICIQMVATATLGMKFGDRRVLDPSEPQWYFATLGPVSGGGLGALSSCFPCVTANTRPRLRDRLFRRKSRLCHFSPSTLPSYIRFSSTLAASEFRACSLAVGNGNE